MQLTKPHPMTPMVYEELSLYELPVNFTKKPHKIHCHVVAIQREPFPKLFVTDFVENEGFLAKLDFREPIDLDGAMILPEEIMGVKLFPDKSVPVEEILLRKGVSFQGPKQIVFDKFILLTISLRLSKFLTRRTEYFLEGILDFAEPMEFDGTNVRKTNLVRNLKLRFDKTIYRKDENYLNLIEPLQERCNENTVTSEEVPLSQFDTCKAEEVDLLAFDGDGLEPSSSSEVEDELEGTQAGPASVNVVQNRPVTEAQVSFPIWAILRLISLSKEWTKAENPSPECSNIYMIRAKIVGVYPFNVKDLVTFLPYSNTVRLRNITLVLCDGTSDSYTSAITVTISNNLEILKFLVADDDTNNSALVLMKLFYEPEEINLKLKKLRSLDRKFDFLVQWTLHKISDSDKVIKRQDWGFVKIPTLDELL